MVFNLFAESCIAYEKDNPDKRIIIIDKDLIKRLDEFNLDNKSNIDINAFIERNLEAMGY